MVRIIPCLRTLEQVVFDIYYVTKLQSYFSIVSQWYSTLMAYTPERLRLLICLSERRDLVFPEPTKGYLVKTI